MNREELKAEIERIEDIKRKKSSHFIQRELKQYLKHLKKQLKETEKE